MATLQKVTKLKDPKRNTTRETVSQKLLSRRYAGCTWFSDFLPWLAAKIRNKPNFSRLVSHHWVME